MRCHDVPRRPDKRSAIRRPDGGAPIRLIRPTGNLKLTLRRVKARTIEQELRQQRYRTTRRAFAFAGKRRAVPAISVCAQLYYG